MTSPPFAELISTLRHSFDSLSDRAVILFGGKGGVGKTTLSLLAAVHFSARRKVTLFSSDPAANLTDVLASPEAPAVVIEQLDAEVLYEDFLDQNLASILELTDRGTYLEKGEARKFFELALPGVDELMAWRRIGQLMKSAEEPGDRGTEEPLLIVDTAPTGHTLRMLSSSHHFEQMSRALATMQQKHKDLIEQFARRRVRDAIDDFLETFRREAAELTETLRDPKKTAFIPLSLAEPLVTEQTQRLAAALRADGINIPFMVMNRVAHSCDCSECQARAIREDAARQALKGETVVAAPRACSPLDSGERLEAYLAANTLEVPRPSPGDPSSLRSFGMTTPEPPPLLLPPSARIIFFAGKGGVGKTTLATSAALQLAAENEGARFTIISVDPAHALPHLLHEGVPENLTIEIIDTRAKWLKLREKIGSEIERVFDAMTPRGVTIAHDAAVMRQLLEVAPPGADEIFAVMRLAHLASDPSNAAVIVDTAPTGHFLRLLDLPRTAGEWVREFMRLLLRYRDLVAPGALGEELVDASRSLTSFDHLLRSDGSATVVVCRPERVVIEETLRLRDELNRRGMQLAGIAANYLTPTSDCRCDSTARRYEEETLKRLGRVVTIERRSSPPDSVNDLRTLLPMRHTRSQ